MSAELGNLPARFTTDINDDRDHRNEGADEKNRDEPARKASRAKRIVKCRERGDPGPGGVTVGEARALDEAAEMLDAQRLPEGASPTAAPSGEAGEPASPPAEEEKPAGG